MADLVAIQQLLARYCFAHDSQDPEMLATTFAKDIRLLGEHGPQVLKEVLGYSDTRVAELRTSGVLYSENR